MISDWCLAKVQNKVQKNVLSLFCHYCIMDVEVINLFMQEVKDGVSSRRSSFRSMHM